VVGFWFGVALVAGLFNAGFLVGLVIWSGSLRLKSYEEEFECNSGQRAEVESDA
jgi:hypothetical protein